MTDSGARRDGAEERDPNRADAGPRQEAAVTLNIALVPALPLYGPGDSVRVQVRATSAVGAEVPSSQIRITVSPESVAVMSGPMAFEVVGEGPGGVTACIDSVCVSRAFRSTSAPFVIIDSPKRGAFLGGDGSPDVAVSGRAFNLGAGAQVRINGSPVNVEPDGSFREMAPMVFGINTLMAEAQDTLHVEPSVTSHRVLWAPGYAEVTAGGTRFARAAAVRLGQDLLDADLSPSEAVVGDFQAEDFAQLVQLLFLQADISELLSTAVIADDATLRFAVEAVDFTTPEVELEIVDRGVELLTRMNGLQVHTNGRFNIEGRPISLDGSLTADITVFALIDITHGETVEIAIPQYDVSVTGIQGAYADEAVNTLLSGLDNRLSLGARGIVEELAGSLIREDLPSLLDIGFGTLAEALTGLPIYVVPTLPGLSSVELRLDLWSKGITHRPQGATTLELGATIHTPLGSQIPHDTLGAPLHRPGAWASTLNTGVGVKVSIDVFNGICHDIWRAGLLRGTPDLPEVVGATIGQVEFDGLLPPVVMASQQAGVSGLTIQLAELILRVTPLGSEATDTYSLHVTIPVTASARQGVVGLEAPEDVSVIAQLVESTSDRPFGAEPLATIVKSTVWPLLREALNQGLRYGVEELVVDEEDLRTITRTVSSLTFAPDLNGAVTYSTDHVTFDGGMLIGGTVADAPND